MVFEVEGKVVLVTGGTSGIGLAIVNEFLKNNVKGIVIADIDEENGEKECGKLKTEFGASKVVFVKTNVSKKDEFENSFKQAIEKFQNLDILINCAGICDEKNWEKMFEVNINGVVNGTLLGLLNYMPKHKSGKEGVIINISSDAGLNNVPDIPLYGASKAAIVSLTKSFGHEAHYEIGGIRVMAICPGITESALFTKALMTGYQYPIKPQINIENIVFQKAENVAKGIFKMLNEGASGSVWISKNNEECYEL